MKPKYIYNDGGREAAGHSGKANDCVCRAISIAAKIPYQEVYDTINTELKEWERQAKFKRLTFSTARSGVVHSSIKPLMEIIKEKFGIRMRWVPTMSIGSGCTVHLRPYELPKGRLICSVSRHYVAVINGVVHDSHDSTRNGNRCVYGYWIVSPKKKAKKS